jgi:CBS domain containing-hemolysin-like protein
VWYYVGIIICVSLSFLFSGLEAGVLSINRIWLSEKVALGNRKAALLQNILNNPSKLISVMLTMETTSNVVLSVLWTAVGHYYFIESNYYPDWLLVIWSVVLLILIVMFCEIFPKALFAAYAKHITLALAPFVYVTIQIIYPIAAVMEFFSRSIIWIFTRKWIKPIKSKVTEEDLITMVNVGEDEGVLEKQEKEMIRSIFEFGDLVAREIMVPRIDMVALGIEAGVQDAIDLIIKHGHSRIPVYKESPDHIKGILYAKDLLRHIETGDLEKLTLEHLIRPFVLFVPGTKKLTSLLEEMRAKKAHMVIVMDEYGGTAGLVTIEDILEEIVGDIQDEYDKPLECLIKKNEDGTWIVDGKFGLHDFDAEIGVKLPEPDGVETVGGLIYQVFGKVPSIGDVISVVPVKDNGNGDFINNRPIIKLVKFKILEVEENRIGSILVYLEEMEKSEDTKSAAENMKQADIK